MSQSLQLDLDHDFQKCFAMAERKPAKKDTQKPAKSTATDGKSKGFTDEERAAMKERAQELKAAKSKADGEREVLAKIAEMQESDRLPAERGLQAFSFEATKPFFGDIEEMTHYEVTARGPGDVEGTSSSR